MVDRRVFIRNVLFLSGTFFAKSIYSLDQGKREKFKSINWKNARISQLAYKTAMKEGQWKVNNVEGSIPFDINGTIVRVGPGNKELFENKLNHFFDGDSFLQCTSFKNGEATFRAEYIKTEFRTLEQDAGKMLFNEFGTLAPKKTRKLKNNPNINVINYGGEFLALSEGGHPSLLDKNLNFKSVINFKGQLKKNVSFSAHPKMDARTGKLYSFGITQGFPMSLEVFEIEPKSGELKTLYSIKQSKVYMIHDMMMSENYLGFVIPPLSFNILDILSGKKTLADALHYQSHQGNKLLILEKKENGRRFELSLPSSVIFHLGNMFEEDNELKFTSFEATNDSLLNVIKNWNSTVTGGVEKPRVLQWSVDFKNQRITGKKVLTEGHDFPCFNSNFMSKRANFLYCAELGTKEDPLRFQGVSKIDIELGLLNTYKCEAHQSFGEPVFYAKGSKEDDGYLFVPGYDGKKDESFLDILEAETLERISRLWFGYHFPVGFHGNFFQNDFAS